MQLQQEDLVQKIAKQYREKTLILLDRGLLDTKAYASPEDVKRALDSCGLVEQEILSNRYDGVIHLVTAADGAEEFYSLANNTARTETPEQARDLDTKVKQAYIGSPKLHIIDNSTSFEEKLERTGRVVSHILGVPQPLKVENKYLVKVSDWEELLKTARCIDIDQRYIQTGNIEERVRIRSIDGIGQTYYHNLKRPF